MICRHLSSVVAVACGRGERMQISCLVLISCKRPSIVCKRNPTSHSPIASLNFASVPFWGGGALWRKHRHKLAYRFPIDTLLQFQAVRYCCPYPTIKPTNCCASHSYVHNKHLEFPFHALWTFHWAVSVALKGCPNDLLLLLICSARKPHMCTDDFTLCLVVAVVVTLPLLIIAFCRALPSLIIPFPPSLCVPERRTISLMN